MRIKALPLSQSKQKKRTEEVITIQRGKDSWNQRPQTSGSLTPPLTRAPPAHVPASMRTTTPTPLCSAPTPSSPTTGPPSPCHTCCLMSPTPSPPLRTRAPTLAYKTSRTSSLSSHPKQNTPDKSPLPNHKQLHFPLPRP
jgi:hypothetical protein